MGICSIDLPVSVKASMKLLFLFCLVNGSWVGSCADCRGPDLLLSQRDKADNLEYSGHMEMMMVVGTLRFVHQKKSYAIHLFFT